MFQRYRISVLQEAKKERKKKKKGRIQKCTDFFSPTFFGIYQSADVKPILVNGSALNPRMYFCFPSTIPLKQ